MSELSMSSMAASAAATEPPVSNCLVCGQSAAHVALIDGRSLYGCGQCGLRFFASQDVPVNLYAQAYEGQVQSAHMQEYLFRAQYLFDAKADAATPPVFSLSLAWLRAHAAPGARVLDIGCGRGMMLRLLRAHGFEAVGLDLSPRVAATLAAQGFSVAVGHARSYPTDLAEPDYLTCNYVLHHPAEPIRFLGELRARFPRAPLLLTQGMGHSWIHALGLPISPPEYPRDLTTWTTQALALAFEKAGYSRHEFIFTRPDPQEVALPLQRKLMTLAAQPAGAALKAAGGKSTVAYASVAAKAIKTILFGVPALYARVRRLPAAAVLVVAQPDA